MNWSSPIRKSHDGKTLPYIPTEIYLEILCHIKYNIMAEYDDNPPAKRTLASLSLVCRFFFATISPWLFHSLYFSDSERKLSEIPSAYRFCRKLLARDKHSRLMARFVKKCEFISWKFYSSHEIRLSRRCLKLYSESLLHFHNLEELCLAETTISKDLLKSIPKLQNLTTLKVFDCTIEKDVKTKHFKKLSCLKLRYLAFDCSTPDEPLSYFNLDLMLHLKMRTWPSSPPYGVGKLSSLPLETFAVNVLPHVSAVGPFLTMVPHLKHLAVFKVPTQDIDDSKLTNAGINFVPKLETIRCPPPLFRFFGPRHKLTSINIPPMYFMDESMFKCLRDSACPISRLSISSSIYSSVPLWKYLPELDWLEVALSGGAFNGTFHVVDDFVTCQAKHPKVKFLQLRTGGFIDKDLVDLPYQRAILSRILNCFPTLRVFSVLGYILWTYSQSSGTWNPEVAPEKELEILSLLERDLEFVESRPYSECFARSVAFEREADPDDFAIMMSRHTGRHLAKIETPIMFEV